MVGKPQWFASEASTVIPIPSADWRREAGIATTARRSRNKMQWRIASEFVEDKQRYRKTTMAIELDNVKTGDRIPPNEEAKRHYETCHLL
jgi:hypothetical protein